MEDRETPKQRHDRELIELLNELRVALPGVQVLFAFLLAVPFSRGYQKVTQFEKVAFFVSLVTTALSSALLIANHEASYGALPALRERSVAIPADLSVICYEDSQLARWWSATRSRQA